MSVLSSISTSWPSRAIYGDSSLCIPFHVFLARAQAWKVILDCGCQKRDRESNGNLKHNRTSRLARLLNFSFMMFGLVILLALFSGFCAHAGEMRIKFTDDDIAVINKIRSIDGLTDLSSKLILSSPVILLLTSAGEPYDQFITISTVDWNQMANGASSLKRLGACKINEILIEHLDSGLSNNVPVGNAQKYFMRLQEVFAARCEQ